MTREKEGGMPKRMCDHMTFRGDSLENREIDKLCWALCITQCAKDGYYDLCFSDVPDCGPHPNPQRLLACQPRHARLTQSPTPHLSFTTPQNSITSPGTLLKLLRTQPSTQTSFVPKP